MDENLTQTIRNFGFPDDRARLIHAFVGGSALHGVKLPGTDDTDIYGIFVEHPEVALGLDAFEHFVTSTAAQADRNKPTDVDITCYSLRKWARLAARGNPTVLQFLFTPSGAGLGDWAWSAILGQREKFLAKSHYKQYAGYAEAQLARMLGLRGRGKHGQRPELEQVHGYDTKAAMHVHRLLHEGIELVSTGWITLPRPAAEREELLAIRRGDKGEAWIIAEANRLFQELKEAAEKSPFPAEVNHAEVSKLLANVYQAVWLESANIQEICAMTMIPSHFMTEAP